MKHKFFLSLAVAALTTTAQAETRDIITYESAASAVQACADMAREKGWNLSIVVVDRGDHVIASARMTDALSASCTGANLKASSALAWNMPTRDIETFISDKPEFRAFPGLLTIAGGVPVKSSSGSPVGAIGVAGSSPDNDAACAEKAASSIQQ